jgi:hypothetical protein
MKLLTTSAKIEKSQNDEWLNAILYLDPNYNNQVCKGASSGCKKSCLIHNGRMAMESAVNARHKRTELYFNDYNIFMLMLRGEIMQLLAKAKRQGKRLALRLNGTSDLDFTCIYKEFTQVQFYEYTKRPDLAKKLKRLSNVHITFSKHEKHSDDVIKRMIDAGVNVAVVFDAKRHELPQTFKGYPVLDGDRHDRRFEDNKGNVIGLSLKGTNKAKQAARLSGFAV